MKELTNGANSQASSLQESAAAVEEMSSSMSAISQKTQDVIRQSEEIKNIIVIIRDIADQTNRRINSEFSGVFEYQNKRYGGQCIFMDKALADQIEAFKNLDCKNGMAIKNLKADPMQILILKELASSKIYGGKMREIFMEAKILEMIYRCFGDAKSDKKDEFNEDEIKILNKAQQILLSDLQNPPSIKELARVCATNEFKLKTSFKKYFGTTIYGLLANERLGIAKELLSQNDISVKEAANMVGYASAPHFAKIFKAK